MNIKEVEWRIKHLLWMWDKFHTTKANYLLNPSQHPCSITRSTIGVFFFFLNDKLVRWYKLARLPASANFHLGWGIGLTLVRFSSGYTVGSFSTLTGYLLFQGS